jgi:hypothetical protein
MRPSSSNIDAVVHQQVIGVPDIEASNWGPNIGSALDPDDESELDWLSG